MMPPVWSTPEVTCNDNAKPVTYRASGCHLLYGASRTSCPRDFARVWRKAEQIVFSRTLTRAPTRIARVEREFDPEATRKLKRESAHDIFIGGAELAALALESDLVDECHLFLHPVIVGGGKPAFRTAIRQNLELLETRRFGTGAIHLRYR